MGFVAISLDKYINLHLKNNPSESRAGLIERLNTALSAHLNGVTCSCGNDIWVIGSATAGNGCFTCITGEAYPDSDYEIDSAIEKKHTDPRQDHIDDPIRKPINGFFDDDGTPIDPDLIKKPSMCVICANNNNPHEEILCVLTRYDQRDSDDFKCFAFRKI